MYDNFFALGGHSLLGARLIARISKILQKNILISDLFERPTVSSLAEYIRSLKPTLILEFDIPLEKDGKNNFFQLSYAQERMWFLHKFVKGSPYNTAGLLLLKGNLNIKTLENSIKAVINRHAILRTNFIEKDNAVYQVVDSISRFSLPIYKIQNRGELDKVLKQKYELPFDLTKDLLIRIELFQTKKNQFYLFIVTHHIIFDSWSVSVFFNELTACYSAYLNNEEPKLAKLSSQYHDYAQWERNYCEKTLVAEKLSYWKTQLADVTPLVLPTKYIRPAFQDFSGEVVWLEFENELIEGIFSLSKKTGATLYMIILSAFTILLSRYSMQKDICIGCPVANRNFDELYGLIGLFVNTLAIRIKLDNQLSFNELLSQVREITLKAYENQIVPFEKIIEQLQVDRDTSRSPLVQVVFNFQNTPIAEFKMSNLSVKSLALHNQTSKFEITLDLTLSNNRIYGFIEYATALFDKSYINCLIDRLKILLKSAINEPQLKIKELPMLNDVENKALLKSSLNIKSNKNINDYLKNFFQNPLPRINSDNPVINFADNSLTLLELSKRINKMVKYLSVLLKTDAVVGFYINNSIEMIITVFALLKLGLTCIPLDLDASAEQLYDLLYDSKLNVIVSKKNFIKQLPLSDQTVILIDDYEIVNNPLEMFIISREDLAFIKYYRDDNSMLNGVMLSHAYCQSIKLYAKFLSI